MIRGSGTDDDLHCASHEGDSASLQSAFLPLPASCGRRRLGQWLHFLCGNSHIVTAYPTHQNPEYFPDPERFAPDRFLPENSIGRQPCAYIPFGIGRRLCVGHYYAKMESKTILSTVMRRCRTCAVEGGISALKKSVQFALTLKTAHGFGIILVPRCVT